MSRGLGKMEREILRRCQEQLDETSDYLWHLEKQYENDPPSCIFAKMTLKNDKETVSNGYVYPYRVIMGIKREMLKIPSRENEYGIHYQNISGYMREIARIKSGYWRYEDGHQLTDEQLETHDKNKNLRSSLNRAKTSLIRKGYLMPTEKGSGVFTLNHKCNRLDTNIPNDHT